MRSQRSRKCNEALNLALQIIAEITKKLGNGRVLVSGHKSDRHLHKINESSPCSTLRIRSVDTATRSARFALAAGDPFCRYFLMSIHYASRQGDKATSSDHVAYT
ncbi:hypothetical protein ACLKA6_001200 [Drosophila palustris]